MPYSLQHDAADDLVVVTFTDLVVTIDLIRQVAPQVMALCEETGCHRILNDMSGATIDVSVLDIYRSPAVMDESGVSRTTRRALVVPADFRDAVFLEQVTRNRGHNLSVFQSVDEARDWLLNDPFESHDDGG